MATRVFAQLKSKPGNEDAVREIMQQLVLATRQETGVNFYELFETLEGGEFIVNEEYKDAAAFDAHMASAHLQHAAATVSPLLVGGLAIWNTKLIS